MSRYTEKIIKLVEQGLQESPWPYDGAVWVAAPQDDWAAELGCSTRTFRSVVSKPPFDTARTVINGKTVCLVRIGEPRPKTPRHLANIMAKMFRAKTGKVVSRHNFGCLVGCAELWPADCAIEIFKCVLANWGAVRGLRKGRAVRDRQACREEASHQGMVLRVPVLVVPS